MMMVVHSANQNPKSPIGVHLGCDQAPVTAIAYIIFIFLSIARVLNHICVTVGLRNNPPPQKI